MASIKSLQTYIRKNRLDAFFLADISNVRYLTTFSGTAGFCLVFSDAAYFLTDFRYKGQAKEEVISCKIEIFSGKLFDYLGRNFFRTRARKQFSVGIEDTLSIDAHSKLSEVLQNCRLVKTSGVVEKLASVKSEPEVERIKNACSVSGTALDLLVQENWLGKREKDLSATLEFNQKILGASKESFDTIVAGGPRGALPHGVASDRGIEDNEFVTIDFGCVYDGYSSDITRTFQTGSRINAKLEKIFQVVYDAQRKGIDAAHPGTAARKVDKAARDYIEKKGYGKYFGHGLGHGIGLRVHELPRISKISEDVLEVGNVITIEPGIYIPKLGGVRIEDDFLVTKDGLEQLSHFSKDRDYYLAHGSWMP
ncbi:MAG TPA: aminopeptidase P family protein [Candidatus Acidoferrales bacterium]|nr:aminopeptidase P family protein [Candidatus Acidoferrales bacterium]